jgi:hypothetical protein
MASRLSIAAILMLASGCSDSEILVRVSALEGDMLAPDAFRIEVFGPRDLGPALRIERAVTGQLPQTFLLKLDEESTRRNVRVRVVAMEEGAPIAAGDAVTRFRDEGRQELGLALIKGCENVACPALERCHCPGGDCGPEALRCDGTCVDESCDLLGLCTAKAYCDFLVVGELGSCRSEEPDPILGGITFDHDESGNGTCPYFDTRELGDDCDDRDCAVPASGVPPCDGHRDNDCDGLPDELHNCTLPCATSSFDESPLRLELDEPIVAVAGVRRLRTNVQRDRTSACESIEEEVNVVLLATDRGVSVRALRATGGTITRVAIPGVRDIAWSGNLVAIAAEEGLVVGRIDETGALQLRTPPYDAGGALRGLTAVALTKGHVWISAEGISLADVALDRLDTLRLGEPVMGLSVDALAAVPGLICGVRRERGELVCWNQGDLTGVDLPAIADARHIVLSSRSEPATLIASSGGRTPTLTAASVDSTAPVATVETRSEVRGLALLGNALVHVTDDSVAFGGFASGAELAGVAAPLLPSGGPITDVSASVAGPAIHVTVARGRTLDVITRRCP